MSEHTRIPIIKIWHLLLVPLQGQVDDALAEQLRQPRGFSGVLPPSAWCFLFSDGVSRRAPFAELSKLTPQDACQSLMRKHRHSHDDASVIVVAAKEPDR